jgi:hypothetical protein
MKQDLEEIKIEYFNEKIDIRDIYIKLCGKTIKYNNSYGEHEEKIVGYNKKEKSLIVKYSIGWSVPSEDDYINCPENNERYWYVKIKDIKQIIQ